MLSVFLLASSRLVLSIGIAALNVILLISPSILYARNEDIDDGVIETLSDERRQRMEMLRSENPSAAYRSNPTINTGNNSRPLNKQLVENTGATTHYQEKTKRKPIGDTGSSLHTQKKAPQPIPNSSNKISIANKSNQNTQRTSHSRKSVLPIKKEIKTKLPQVKSKNRAIRDQGSRGPRCGFCLVNGYLYCGDQGVSLENLIEQNQKHETIKRNNKKSYSKNHIRMALKAKRRTEVNKKRRAQRR